MRCWLGDLEMLLITGALISAVAGLAVSLEATGAAIVPAGSRRG